MASLGRATNMARLAQGTGFVSIIAAPPGAPVYAGSVWSLTRRGPGDRARATPNTHRHHHGPPCTHTRPVSDPLGQHGMHSQTRRARTHHDTLMTGAADDRRED